MPYRRESLPRTSEDTLQSDRKEPIPKSMTGAARAANACLYEVVVPGVSADSYLRIAVTGGTEQGGRSVAADAT